MKAVIVGAGLSSATAASILVRKGWDVEVFETRNHIGGNCYDLNDPRTGIKIHRYGPHAFHTDSEKVWNFLNQFTKFKEFKLQVKAQIESGEIIPIPFNNVSKSLVGEWTSEKIIDELFKTYSKKHWGQEWNKLPASITSRVPKIRLSDNCDYHLDRFQGLPLNGYTKMFEAMFNGCTVYIGCKNEDWKKSSFDLLIYTGSIDSYYDYCFGNLTYRSLRFDFKKSRLTNYIQLNQCNSNPETRIIDHAHWYPIDGLSETILSKEYSEEFSLDNNQTDRFYPKTYESYDLYEKYKKIENPKVLFLGRLGTYKYLDMDVCVAQALKETENI